MQFKLKCIQCGEVILCDESIFDTPMECECGYPIVLEYYPEIAKLKQERDERLRSERKQQKQFRNQQRAEAKQKRAAERAKQREERAAIRAVQRAKRQFQKQLPPGPDAPVLDSTCASVDTVSSHTDPSWTFRQREFGTAIACLAGLALLAASTLMVWVNVLAGGIIGISGNGKFVAVISLAGLALTVFGLRRPKFLPVVMLNCSAWGIVALCWMIGLIYTVASLAESLQGNDSSFATVFASAIATQITPGAGLYVGVLGALIIILSTLMYEALVSAHKGGHPVRRPLRIITKVGSLVVGVLLAVFLGHSPSRAVQAVDLEGTPPKSPVTAMEAESNAALPATTYHPQKQASYPFLKMSRTEIKALCEDYGLSKPEWAEDSYCIVRVFPESNFRVEAEFFQDQLVRLAVMDFTDSEEAERRVFAFWYRVEPQMIPLFEHLRDRQRAINSSSGPVEDLAGDYVYRWSEFNKAIVLVDWYDNINRDEDTTLGDAELETSPPVHPQRAADPPIPKAEKSCEIIEIDAKITERNQVWWKYAWKLTIRNRHSKPKSIDAEIKFLDSDGFIIDTDTELIAIAGDETKTFTGFALIDAEVAGNVESIAAEARLWP